MFLLKIKDKIIDANDNKLIINIWYLVDYQYVKFLNNYFYSLSYITITAPSVLQFLR